MIPNLKELNDLCQKPQYKEVGNWMVRKILRPAAVPITWLLLHTPITANQVTFMAILTGLLGNYLLALPSSSSYLWGTILLQLWYLLDHVDGQIARYRKTSSLTGRFYDFLMHHLIHGTVLMGLGWHLWKIYSFDFWLFWTFIASGSLIFFNLLFDIQYKAYFEKIARNRTIHIKEKQLSLPIAKKTPAFFHYCFSLLHKSCEMHITMNILTLGALLQIFIAPKTDFRVVIFLYYAAAAPILFITKTYRLISSKKIDLDFENTYDIA